jgi:hypothetical protein
MNNTASLRRVNDCQHRYQRDWRLRFSLRQQHQLRCGGCPRWNRGTRNWPLGQRGYHYCHQLHPGCRQYDLDLNPRASASRQGQPSVGCPCLSIPCAYFKQPLLCESLSVPSPLFRIFNKLSSACNTPVMATPHTEGQLNAPLCSGDESHETSHRLTCRGTRDCRYRLG